MDRRLGRRIRVAIVAPTPAPYRAYECDLLHDALSSNLDLRMFFLERSWKQMNWVDDLPNRMPWKVLETVRLPGPLGRLPRLPRLNRNVTRAIAAFDPDAIVLQGHDAPALWEIFFWARRNDRRLLFRCDSNVVIEQERRKRLWRRWLKVPLVRSMYRRIDAFLTTGTSNEEYYRSYGISADRFIRANFLVDFDRIAAGANLERSLGRPTKAALGIRQERVLLFVGRFVPVKGLPCLLDAFSAVADELADLALVLVGDGPLLDALRAKATHLHDRVYFAGFRQLDEVARLYGMADALVLPSLREPYGLVVAEAMAAELPVIASDGVGVACDLVRQNQTGLQFPTGDATQLSAAIRTMFCARETCRTLGKNARANLLDWNRRYDYVTQFRAAIERVMAL
ncbi:MAG: glycosyltransferase family 4 protein [Phycisphaerae bacterium]|nr:glycosyltransferase family 4 protein [Phycisphaerae bacterium]